MRRPGTGMRVDGEIKRFINRSEGREGWMENVHMIVTSILVSECVGWHVQVFGGISYT